MLPGVRAGRILCRILIPIVAAATTGAVADRQDAQAGKECEAAAQAADWEEAIVACEAALGAAPDEFGIHYFLGFAHQARQAWARSASAYEAFVTGAEAAADGPLHFGAEIALAVRSAGIARCRARDGERALPLLRRAAASDPGDAEVSFWLGVCLLEDGESEGAEAAFRAVVREAPPIAEALYFLGRLRYEAQDYEAARVRLDEYLEASPDGGFRADAHWLAGSMALRSSEARGENETAGTEAVRRHFAALLEIEADSRRAAFAHYALGTIAADHDECAAARRHYERFLALAPDHERAPEVSRYLAEISGSAPCPTDPSIPNGLC